MPTRIYTPASNLKNHQFTKSAQNELKIGTHLNDVIIKLPTKFHNQRCSCAEATRHQKLYFERSVQKGPDPHLHYGKYI